MKKLGLIAVTYALPVVALAQVNTNVQDINGIIRFITSLINAAVPIIIALAVLWILWGLFQVVTAGDDDKKAKAKNTIIYGVVALFVMVSIWGLVNILVRTFNLNNNANVTNPLNQIPNLPR